MITTENEPGAGAPTRRLTHGELLELRRWNTPTIYNGWEQVTKSDAGRDGFNLEETIDYMPQMGAMVGYALTVVCEPGNPAHRKNNPDGANVHRALVCIGTIVDGCIRDLDEMCYAGFKALARRLCVRQ